MAPYIAILCWPGYRAIATVTNLIYIIIGTAGGGLVSGYNIIPFSDSYLNINTCNGCCTIKQLMVYFQ